MSFYELRFFHFAQRTSLKSNKS